MLCLRILESARAVAVEPKEGRLTGCSRIRSAEEIDEGLSAEGRDGNGSGVHGEDRGRRGKAPEPVSEKGSYHL